MSDENNTNISDTLNERGSRYGDFTDNARVSESLMDTLRSEEGYQNLRPIHRAALNVIMQKASRIVNGNPEYKDNWHDIEGYAKLAEDRCLELVKVQMELPLEKRGTTGRVRSDLGLPRKNYDDMWIVSEQLYPESRGFIEHKFSNEVKAKDFYLNTPE